ncbi:MAG: hypothetical protein N0E37_06970 [Candidatus Thiodiazotropha taylori]|nr:hypothetical protein [Candidatus Thiodiazotropha taylori]MCG8070786.1 hypothetical protein [Candidatus Thiodiazotropha taylori]MCG8087955.1 hypothetical protein [Candidatus Thiodiazotropha taylori]MCW4244163.1 hypothetical protein [Candidatus Thiodiazotropha taylori]MCW4324799.1 hypothetical protein [Candidatus Thiodiazotropha taylori]
MFTMGFMGGEDTATGWLDKHFLPDAHRLAMKSLIFRASRVPLPPGVAADQWQSHLRE